MFSEVQQYSEVQWSTTSPNSTTKDVGSRLSPRARAPATTDTQLNEKVHYELETKSAFVL